MTRIWKLSFVFVATLAVGSVAHAQLAVNAGARGQALGSVTSNSFNAPGTLNADGTVHGGFNDGVRFTPDTTQPAAKPAKKSQHNAAATSESAGSHHATEVGSSNATSASVNSGSQSANAGTTVASNASVHGQPDTHK